MKVSKDILQELAWGYDTDGYEFIETQETGKGRWVSYHFLVFRAPDGNTYGVPYQKGLTESQDEQAFEYDPDEIECTPVKAVEKTITVTEWVAT